ncbi:conjugal transfer protein TraE [Eubacterium sp. BL-380-WT-2B]|nr:ATP-binding protein [Eubacterium sp. BL-380-WT-2B]MBD8947169.1 conjugal transfer protein TraE [Clostridiales bacterium]MSS95003.1 conjugal transfer protein TraE [Eubacterium sp. BL-380-WT-2B]
MQGKIAMSAQDTIAYKEMRPDGICIVKNGYYTKTIQFYDINYQLARNEDKNIIFENYCDFLNYFDKSITVQLSFLNQTMDISDFEKSIAIKPQGDAFDEIRAEYTAMLKNQLARGNNGIVRKKYITFGVEADNIQNAKQRLERVETDIINNFKVLGVRSYPLNGMERLELLHNCFNGGGNKLNFSWNLIHQTGLTTKDFIAPTSFDFSDGKYFKMGRTIGAVSFLHILAPELTDEMLKNFLEIQSSLAVNIHIKSIDQTEAIKMIKRKITDLDRMKIEEQKKAVRSGYDMDIIPSDINTFGVDAKKLLEDLQGRNERMFLVTVLVMNTAENRKELKSSLLEAEAIAQQKNCPLRRLDYQQEDGLMASVPIGINNIQIERALTTSSAAIFVPFTTQELFSESKEALYCGLNALSNNMIMVDRKMLKNPNGLILGTPGSGKSFAAKREIANAFLVTNDDIYVCDPEAEYYSLVSELKGQVVRLSPTSKDYLNPLDINLNYSDEENPISLKSDFVLSFCELIIGGKNGLEPIEKTVIDRSVTRIYQKYFENPVPSNMPILEDLYEEIKRQPEQEAGRIASALELYVKGSLNVFNHHTNVDISNRIVCFDIKELGKQLKKLGMLVVQDQIWNRVTINRNEHKSTRYYCDEFHLLLKDEQTAAYSVEIWKRFRKWGGIPTGITQNVKDLLSSAEIENIFENSDYIYMLNQAQGDREILAKKLGISPQQLSYVTQSGAGEGLLFYGNTIIPFIDRFPKDTKLYRLMTTIPQEVAGNE